MRVKINGKYEETKANTILELLQSKEVEPQMVSVELNSKILDREAYASTKIQEGDEIEFLFFMGGGTGGLKRISDFEWRILNPKSWQSQIRNYNEGVWGHNTADRPNPPGEAEPAEQAR